MVKIAIMRSGRGLAATVAALMVLAACEDDPLSGRKLHCDGFVKNGHISKGEGNACYSDRSVFAKGALGKVKDDMEYWYPRILRGAEKLNIHARTYDKSGHLPLPLGVHPPLFLSDEEEHKDWRYVVELQNVSIDRPEGEGDRNWTLFGEREGEEGLHQYDIMGVGVYALQELDFSCVLFNDRQSGTGGCRAKVYIDVARDGLLLPVVAAMAIELTPPSEEEARRTYLEGQMHFWDPIKKR